MIHQILLMVMFIVKSDNTYLKLLNNLKKNSMQMLSNFSYPIRNQIYQIGGSNAQRDLFYLLLIHSAVYSKSDQHRKLAKQLINEKMFNAQ